jgi:hypothetical protein
MGDRNDIQDTEVVTQDRLAETAVKRIKARRDFMGHLLVYLLVNGLLVGIWLVVGLHSGSWFFWPVFPILGWGIGVAMNAWAVYGPPSEPITDDAIAEEVERLRRRTSGT